MQIVELFTATGGKGFTVIVAVAVFVHPLASVPVTVYIVVAVGAPVTGLPLVGVKPVVGAQL